MKFTVIGAGNTGQAIAGYLAEMNQEVLLYTSRSENVDRYNKEGIKLEGAIEAHVSVKATSEIKEAVQWSSHMIISTTAMGHKNISQLIKPHIKDGQSIIIFNGNWGALEFKNTLYDEIIEKNLTIAETGAMMLICQSKAPGQFL